MNYSRRTYFTCDKLYCGFDDDIYVCVCVMLMLSYILLELNFLLYNVPILEAPHPGAAETDCIKKIKPLYSSVNRQI
jgi:hypothetical protein